MPNFDHQEGPSDPALADVPAGDLTLHEFIEQRYAELKELARKMNWHDPRASLTATALLNETYLRVSKSIDRRDRKTDRELLAIISNVIWQVLVDRARSQHSQKRDFRLTVSLDENADALQDMNSLPPEHILTLEAARNELRQHSPRSAEVFDLRFSVGLTTHQTAQALGLSQKTVERESRAAKQYLRAALGQTSKTRS